MAFGPLKVGSDKATKGKGSLKAKNTSQKLVDANPNRVGLYVYNTGSSPVYLALGEAAAAEEGIFLPKESGDEKITNFSGAVYAITKEGESLLTYVEI
jgi:hypothetical protein